MAKELRLSGVSEWPDQEVRRALQPLALVDGQEFHRVLPADERRVSRQQGSRLEQVSPELRRQGPQRAMAWRPARLELPQQQDSPVWQSPVQRSAPALP